jgi:hypothetical protein
MALLGRRFRRARKGAMPKGEQGLCQKRVSVPSTAAIKDSDLWIETISVAVHNYF